MDEMDRTLREAGLLFPDGVVRDLAVYRDMLDDWNQRMDLTNVPREEMCARHFLDSLLPLKADGMFPPNARIIDVGTGAGFPGLALAIARPDMTVTLLEAQGKRCAFLNAVRQRLGLSRVTVIQDRAEVLGRNPAHREQYDRAAARAVAPLNVLCEYLLPFVKTGGYALCWKGPALEGETADGAFAARLLGGQMEAPVLLAGPDRQHAVAKIFKTERTVPQYPRKNGIPAKRPLKNDKK